MAQTALQARGRDGPQPKLPRPRFDATAAPAHVARVLAAGGAPLDPAIRADLEPRFGRDFGDLRIHTGPDAAASARALGARAYAAGHHLVFAAGQFAPGTPAGRHLLAHEIAHAVQAVPAIARQEDPAALHAQTGKTEGAGQSIKPITLDGITYVYVIWGRWNASDTLDSFRDRVLRKWVRWRFGSDSTPEAKNVVGFLLDSGRVAVRGEGFQPGGFYSIGVDKRVLVEVRHISGEIDREADARKKAADASAGEVTAPDGERAVEVKGDPGALAGNPALAALYLDMLARYAGSSIDRKRAEHGLTADAVAEITKGNAAAQDITGLFTQGWREYGAAGGMDVTRFGFLEEALLTQRARGNFTALHNQLAFDKGAEGFGLYKRGTPFRFYDENGQPVSQVTGGYRDPGYRSMTPPRAAVQIPITDRGLLSVLGAIKNVTLDDQVQIYQAAKGYWDNGDLLWPAVRDGWDGFAAIQAELQRQLSGLVLFLGLQAVATVLQRFNDPRAKGAGLLLEAMLKAAGKIFQIVFVGELATLLYACGLELSKVERQPDTATLDALSQAHLEQAALAMRQLLTAAIAAGLTAVMVEASHQTAITLGEKLPPPPPGGGLQPAPAVVGGARVPGGGTAAAAGGPPGFIRPPIGMPIPPANMQTRGSGSGGGSSKPAETDPTGQPLTPAELKTRQIEAQAETLEQVYRDIAEIQAAERKPLTPAERVALAKEKADLVREAGNRAEDRARLLRELEALSVTPYQRARAYSMSEAARKAVIRRARGLDELSGKPADVTVDHIVSVAEIVEMEGWNDLTVEQQRAILSDPENLIGMDRGPNSSKSDQRWADWQNGRRIYGDAVADRMAARETQVRRMLQDKIRASKATR